MSAELVEARCGAASCSLGEYVYTFCGYNDQNTTQNSFERFSITSDKWELVDYPTNQAFTPRKCPVVANLNQEEIIIMGGVDQKLMRDIFIYNATTGKLDCYDPERESIEFYSTSNSIEQVGEDRVIAVVQDYQNKPVVIDFTKSDKHIKILAELY